ncbi:Protein CBG07856 [Caenorhabditis briggsae]|uniref:Protein CBG07856 n=1 Tax=Caenorhabditis briggsae TaxID=6238 RepID=A8X5A2_CAEBR|nr:Protein CBG07856 [Caenorhabditis briggsae]CAP27801.1 Protein CBG07856 [Caenorhabditis briggsae]
MSILLKVLALVAVFQFSSAHRQTSLTDEQVLQLVQLSCNDAKYFCPAERCLVKIGPQRIFNRFAVLKAEEVGLLKSSDIPLTELFLLFSGTPSVAPKELVWRSVTSTRSTRNASSPTSRTSSSRSSLSTLQNWMHWRINCSFYSHTYMTPKVLNPRVAFHVWPSSLAPRIHRTTRLIVESSETDLLQLIVAPPDAGIVGTNTSLGPARLLLDSRKRDSLIGNRAAVPPTIKRQTPLVTYNGGRPGQEIPRYIDLDDSPALSPRRSPPTSLDIQKMLREQPAVKMEVKMGGGGYVKYEKPEDVEEDFEDSDDGESEDVPKSDLAQKIKKTKERVSEEAAIIVFS